LRDVVTKALGAASTFDCRAIYCGGGVSNNLRLRELFSELHSPHPVYYPEKNLTLDNAAMIAGLGFHSFQREKKGDGYDLEPMTRIPLGIR
jgi:N6-L-threonylcarbamoyladenine synthase